MPQNDLIVEQAKLVENCATCGKPIFNTENFFMCDETMGSYHVGPCWDVTACAKGEHGEGCPTAVYQR